MDARLLERLACPACASELRLESFEGEGDDVREGVLLCDGCRTWYPLKSSVPVLLRFPTPLHRTFADARSRQLEAFPGYAPPAGRPRPGEESVQETFTEEWGAVVDSELSFTYSLDDLVELNRKVWLKWLERTDEGEVRSVLDVGCGLGSEAVALHRAVPGAEVVAVDLNFALLSSEHVKRRTPGLHFVTASAFDLPFRPGSFDLVYSQGVLMATYSTREAFSRVAPFVRDGGYFFLWVYAHEDHLAAQGRRRTGMRLTLAIERALRPPVSRAPRPVRNAFFDVASRAAHPILKPRMRHAETWEVANTDNYLRDWLSPRYAHRHGFNEVIEWFEDLGFEIVDVQSPGAYRRLFQQPLWGVGLTGRKTASASA